MTWQSREEKAAIKNKAWLKQYKLDKHAEDQRYRAMSGTKSIEEVDYPSSGKKVHGYSGYGFKLLKNGEYGKLLTGIWIGYCPIYECVNCHIRGSGQHIRYRGGLHGWYGFNFDCSPDLCMSCWNKARAIIKKEEQIKELPKLLTGLRRAIRKAKI